MRRIDILLIVLCVIDRYICLIMYDYSLFELYVIIGKWLKIAENRCFIDPLPVFSGSMSLKTSKNHFWHFRRAIYTDFRSFYHFFAINSLK